MLALPTSRKPCNMVIAPCLCTSIGRKEQEKDRDSGEPQGAEPIIEGIFTNAETQNRKQDAAKN